MDCRTARKAAKVTDISPSLICNDLTNLENGVHALEQAGCTMLHVDVLDGYFSPSMPIGIDTIKQLRKKTTMDFDVHIMAIENDFFVDEMIETGVSRICVHAETERHISKRLSQIRSAGIQAGIALMPATSPKTLEYVLELCDFVLLMRINPGYASAKDEKEYGFVTRKMRDLSDTIFEQGLDTTITVDGRTYFKNIHELVAAGMDTVVGGTSSIFSKQHIIKENVTRLKKLMEEGRSFRP